MDFSQVEALVGLVREHLAHQVFELGTERSALMLFMHSPEITLFVGNDETVKCVVQVCLAKWQDSRTHGENDDAEGV